MSAPWRLRVERGPNAGQSFPIDRASATIGRQDNNAIVLDDARLSRQHARIESGPGGLSVTDLNSANGTLVNGRPVTGTIPLNAGDRLQLGDTTILVEGGPPAFGNAADATMIAEPAGGGAARASAPATDGPRLVVQGTGKVLRLDRPAMVIGRQPENELPLDDSQASRQHARFETRNNQVTITDLGSANGTKVNGSRISAPTPLSNGDVVQIGATQLRVEGAAFVDHGTAAALGFFPPPSTGPALGGAPPPPIEGATMIGSAPPMMTPPPLGGGPPLGAPPPLGGPPPGGPALPSQPWNTPQAPQFGGPPPPIMPPVSPARPAQRSRSPLPIILIGLAAILLLVCVGGGVGFYILSQNDDNADATVTPVAAAGTPVPAVASTPMPAAGSAGGNTAPPAPGASVAPSAAASASARPSAAASAAAGPTPTAPRASARPSASAAGNRRTLEVQSVGLTFSIPADWQEARNEQGLAQFNSPDGRAQIIVRWSTQVPSSVTARSLIQQELQDTAGTDPSFDPTAVPTGNVTVGGQPGFGSEIYTFSNQSGTRISEADRAVVLTGRAQYFFGFLALESSFSSYAATFDEIIESIQITGP